MGDAANSMLGDLTSKYEGALNESARPDPMLEERKRSIGEGIRSIEGKLKAIQDNSEAVYRQICDKHKQVIDKLDTLTKQKT